MLAKNYKDEEDRLNNHTKGKKVRISLLIDLS